ncbi:MAG: hypothetical protein WAU33_11715 [Candidatus Binataceae bacterium]
MNLMLKLRYLPALVLICCVLMGAAAAPTTLATLSIPPVALAANERIFGIDCIIRPVRIVTIRDVPAEWRASIANAAQGFSAVMAQPIVASAAFASGTPGLFTNFITIEKSRIPRRIQVRVTIKIASLAKPAQFRYVNYVLKDVKITPIGGGSPSGKSL